VAIESNMAESKDRHSTDNLRFEIIKSTFAREFTISVASKNPSKSVVGILPEIVINLKH